MTAAPPSLEAARRRVREVFFAGAPGDKHLWSAEQAAALAELVAEERRFTRSFRRRSFEESN